MALAKIRVLVSFNVVTWSASEKAASTAARSPDCQRMAMLSGASGQIVGAPGMIAASTLVTQGNGSMVTPIVAAASAAWSAVSATTMAIGSPTLRTQPWATPGSGVSGGLH